MDTPSCIATTVVLVLATQSLASCAHAPSVATTRQLFAKVEIGMSRAEVDALLGEPVSVHHSAPPPSVGEEEGWYLPPPPLDPIDSPFAEGSIGVVFGSEGRVVSKRLNPHVRDR
jgi:hypothetical protein